MSRKVIVGGAIAVALLFVAAYVGSPFWSARQFRDAALSGDVDRLDGSVDFPAVRESLKSQLTVAMTAKMENDPSMKGNPFAGLGMMMMPVIINRMVDSFVTPDGMSAIIKRGRVQRGNADPTVNTKVSYSYSYRSLDRFVVVVKAPEAKAEEQPKFVFERRGLFSWKLIRLDIPNEVFADKR